METERPPIPYQKKNMWKLFVILSINMPQSIMTGATMTNASFYILYTMGGRSTRAIASSGVGCVSQGRRKFWLRNLKFSLIINYDWYLENIRTSGEYSLPRYDKRKLYIYFGSSIQTELIYSALASGRKWA